MLATLLALLPQDEIGSSHGTTVRAPSAQRHPPEYLREILIAEGGIGDTTHLAPGSAALARCGGSLLASPPGTDWPGISQRSTLAAGFSI